MSLKTLAEIAERNPAKAADVFDRLDGALNLVLQGSDTHERYLEAREIGLAVVIGKGHAPNSFNPLDPSTPERLAFLGSNRTSRPGAWEPKPEADKELLGDDVPEELGRFAAFALAKINRMSVMDRGGRSYYPGSVKIAPGQVGFAGGRWILGSVIGVSGLWEVHDHIMADVYADELMTGYGPDTQRTADDLAAKIEPVLARIQRQHLPVRAEDIAHANIGPLLDAADNIASERYSLPY